MYSFLTLSVLVSVSVNNLTFLQFYNTAILSCLQTLRCFQSKASYNSPEELLYLQFISLPFVLSFIWACQSRCQSDMDSPPQYIFLPSRLQNEFRMTEVYKGQLFQARFAHIMHGKISSSFSPAYHIHRTEYNCMFKILSVQPMCILWFLYHGEMVTAAKHLHLYSDRIHWVWKQTCNMWIHAVYYNRSSDSIFSEADLLLS